MYFRQVWKTPGTNADADLIQAGSSFTLSESIFRHLRQGKRVWLTGHSKGGAVATTAAANLICGRIDPTDSANLAGISVVTFNSPLVFKTRFAGVYEEACRRFRIDHMRVQNENDIVPNLPRWQGLAHVGRKVARGETLSHEKWRARKAGKYLEQPSAAILEQILKRAVRVCLNHSVDAIPRHRDIEGRTSVQSIAHSRGHPGRQPRRYQGGQPEASSIAHTNTTCCALYRSFSVVNDAYFTIPMKWAYRPLQCWSEHTETLCLYTRRQ